MLGRSGDRKSVEATVAVMASARVAARTSSDGARSCRTPKSRMVVRFLLHCGRDTRPAGIESLAAGGGHGACSLQSVRPACDETAREHLGRRLASPHAGWKQEVGRWFSRERSIVFHRRSDVPAHRHAAVGCRNASGGTLSVDDRSLWMIDRAERGADGACQLPARREDCRAGRWRISNIGFAASVCPG